MTLEKLKRLYSLTPETGLYSEHLDKPAQAMIFLKYLKFLRQRLYEGPRSTELRRLTKIMRETCCEKPDETRWLFNALNVQYDDDNVQFNDLMDSYVVESDAKKAGPLYKEYSKHLAISQKDPHDAEKLDEIRSGLAKKYPAEEVAKKLRDVVNSTTALRERAKHRSIEIYELLQKDRTYLSWKKLIDTWESIGFLDLANAYHKLDSETGALRSANGVSLEDECIETLLTYFAELHKVTPDKLSIVRNTIIRGSKWLKTKEMVGEIDVIVINTVTDSIVGLVEVKSGIYDIPQAVEQLEKIMAIIAVDPSVLSKKVNDDVRSLVVTTIPPHNPVTGASFSDVQLISSVLFSKTDTRLRTIVNSYYGKETENTDKVIDLDGETVEILTQFLTELREKMVSHISPLSAIERLGQNLIIV
ncbi:hypothetical protein YASMINEVIRUS_1324 [Yasminevirus sp. GU-2018]|uniref:Uncharacterized protein n=1 Tax=Yasminevirus sp. GU-2018 TaxID=2420051 RepID=A0A5K0UB34_9VIRU|nr:hypothetical protein YASMINEVIRUS_1324 [Yasminevirus sp. GU-2018]